jgi:predicted kinase
MTELVIVRGIPGSGKSTYAKTLGYLNYEADQYFIDPEGNYLFDATKLYQAHRWCQEKTRSALSDGLSVVVSNTFTTRKEMKDYLEMAYELHIPVRVVKVLGNFQNVHGVPEEALERMRNRWQDVEGESVVDNRIMI